MNKFMASFLSGDFAGGCEHYGLQLNCPFCRDGVAGYVHLEGISENQGREMDAWAGGDYPSLRIQFSAECGHHWFFRIGFQKGIAFADIEPIPTSPEDADGFVYFIEAIGLKKIKVGYSKDVESRLRQLQTAMPFEMRILASVPGTIALESEIHRLFAKTRVRGEWFEDTEKLREYIAAIRRTVGETPCP